MSYSRPINKAVLVHTIELYKTKLIDESSKPAAVIKNVRIQPNMVAYNNRGLEIQAGMGNFQLFGDATYSTPLPEGVEFAVGDIIKGNFYPYKFVIRKVNFYYTAGNENLHHIELGVD